MTPDGGRGALVLRGMVPYNLGTKDLREVGQEDTLCQWECFRPMRNAHTSTGVNADNREELHYRLR